MTALVRRGVIATAGAGAVLLLFTPVAAAAEPGGTAGSSAIGVVEIVSWAIAFLASALGIV